MIAFRKNGTPKESAIVGALDFHVYIDSQKTVRKGTLFSMVVHDARRLRIFVFQLIKLRYL